MTQPPETIDHWFSLLSTEARGLTSWEEDFVDSLWEQWVEHRGMSDRQEEILERIYASRTP